MANNQPPAKNELLDLDVLDLSARIRLVPDDVVEEYAERLEAGSVFPPVVVFHAKETGAYFMADGFIRLEAYRRAGSKLIPCEIRPGVKRDAILFAAGANQMHGLRRTNADKRAAVLALLNDPECVKWKDREIARHVGVTHPFVGTIRASLSGNGYQMKPTTADTRSMEPRKVGPTPEGPASTAADLAQVANVDEEADEAAQVTPLSTTAQLARLVGESVSLDAPKSGLATPLVWYGGKASHTGMLLPLIPPHEHYVEVFGGGASLLVAKSPALSKGETYNDLNRGVVTFYEVLRDEQKCRKLHELLQLTPNSRDEHVTCRKGWPAQTDELERARQFFVANRQSVNGSTGWKHFPNGRCGRNGEFARLVDTIPDIATRFRSVAVECLPFERLIEKYDEPTAFFYLDPPYVLSTRRCKAYEHEMTDDDHRRLVNILLGIKGMALLSGYDNEIYQPLDEAGWKRTTYRVKCSAASVEAGGVREERTEVVWLNPAALAAHRARVEQKAA